MGDVFWAVPIEGLNIQSVDTFDFRLAAGIYERGGDIRNVFGEVYFDFGPDFDALAVDAF